MVASRPPAGQGNRTETIALDLHLVEGVGWEAMSDQHRGSLPARLRGSRWRGSSPNRFSFTQVSELDATIYGYFSQEFPDVLRQYDERKTVTETIQPNFVDLVFLLTLENGYLLLQDRRFRNEGDLSMPQSRERFGSALAAVTRRLGLGEALLTPKEYLPVSKDEFLAVIGREEIWELDVDNIEGRSIPDEAVLFNPDVDEERLYREVWNRYERENVSRIRMTRARRGNLGQSKIARAAAQAGDPKRITYGAEAPGHRVRRVLERVKKTHMPGVTVHRPINEEDVARILRTLADLLEGTDGQEQRSPVVQADLGLEEENDG